MIGQHSDSGARWQMPQGREISPNQSGLRSQEETRRPKSGIVPRIDHPQESYFFSSFSEQTRNLECDKTSKRVANQVIRSARLQSSDRQTTALGHSGNGRRKSPFFVARAETNTNHCHGGASA